MSSHTEPTHAAGHHDHGAGIFHTTLILLLILTGITVGASYIHFESGAVNIAIALFVASIKATLVALFFMHLKYDKPVNGIIAFSGFLFLGIFVLFCLIDLNTRRDPSPATLHPPTITEPVPGASPMPKKEGEKKDGDKKEAVAAKADTKADTKAAEKK